MNPNGKVVQGNEKKNKAMKKLNLANGVYVAIIFNKI